MDSHDPPRSTDQSPGAVGAENPAARNRPERSLHVLDLYARLAADRAIDTHTALQGMNSADELLTWSAQALEDAAGTLTLISEMYAADREAFSRLLYEQAQALVVLAAQCEQAADLARHDREHRGDADVDPDR